MAYKPKIYTISLFRTQHQRNIIYYFDNKSTGSIAPAVRQPVLPSSNR